MRAAAKEIRLEVLVPGELPARGDPKRTGQILAVLLDNAVRFAPPGGNIAVTGRLHDRWVETSVTARDDDLRLVPIKAVIDLLQRGQAT